MRCFTYWIAAATFLVTCSSWLFAQDRSVAPLGVYEYESKPEVEELVKFNPRKAPSVGPLMLRKGDRLAIVGDSITEQKMYSRLIETYLTVCVPELEITARQYGWSGEKTDGFLRRMEDDCLRFHPTVATICYGMNDARYRPFDITNGEWYRDHYTAIIQRFKQAGVRPILGSPGSAGKLATWVKSRSGTLDEHNLHLCALRDIGILVAKQEQVPFADIFWPMYQAQVLAPKKYPAPEGQEAYQVAGKDGIHPGWAGQVIMAYAFLRAMGLDGDLGTITIDLNQKMAAATKGHHVDQFENNKLTLTSSQYPFCATGSLDSDNSIRSGMTLVPFHATLNRLTLKVIVGSPAINAKQMYRITWGSETREYSAQQLSDGINLAEEFATNPFSDAFEKVSEAVYKKQAYETRQVKEIFHGPRRKREFDKLVEETEAEREPLAVAISQAFVPVTHSLVVEAL